MAEIIDIGDLRIKRNRTQYLSGEGCKHLQMVFDDEGQIVSCETCKRQLGLYWAFGLFIEQYKRWRDEFVRKKSALDEAISKEVVLLAAQRVEKAWRSRSMVPSCPHCHRGILSTDGFGNSTVSKELEIKRREKAIKDQGPCLVK